MKRLSTSMASYLALNNGKYSATEHAVNDTLGIESTRRLAALNSDMLSTTDKSTSSVGGALGSARRLVAAAPSREEQLRRDPYVRQFWHQYSSLLENAWQEWAATEGSSLPKLDSSLCHPDLRRAIEDAWKDPSKEDKVRKLWTEVAPGVYQCQFIDPSKIHLIRKYLDEAHEAKIPTRPPHGITLNRNGFMLDPRSEGYLAIPEFQKWYSDLMDTYMRPLGRLFYPEYISAEDDCESFAFSIGYQAEKDTSIQQHTDASALTLNINLNLPDGAEEYSGSSLYFVDRATGKKHTVTFAPGVAIMHRGAVPHAALPITGGERTNIVLWEYGKQGRVNHYPYPKETQLTREERWTKPVRDANEPLEKWTPF